MSAVTAIGSISQCFAARVSEGPSRPAVRAGDCEFSYADLDARSNGLARELQARRLVAGDRVAVRLARTDLLVPTILGILKAGCVYVPLDPTYPEARTRSILDDCSAALVISDDGDGLDPNAVSPSNESPTAIVEPDALACIVYTSGSTGTPKGVMQTHASLVAFVRNYIAPFGVSSGDRLSMLYSYSFAAANMDVFGALLSGATVCFYPLRERGVAGLAARIAGERVSILHTIPTVFRQLIASLEQGDSLATVRAVDLGGEPVLSVDVDRFREHFPETALLVNHYAATELSVIAQMPISASTHVGPGAVPAGYAAHGVEIRIVDADGADVPSGTEGEIVAQSVHMSAGYWNQPELTARNFATDPASGGLRIYRTGDLGRLAPDGCLQHLGRVDDRIKIRGQSVEVAEVENALVAFDEIAEAVVTARPSPAGSTRLVAFVVSRAGAFPTAESIRQRLAVSLPESMIPSAVVLLDRLPLTPSGKVDRAALPEPDQARPSLEAVLVEPRDDLESTLCRMWEEITGVKPVGVHDDFFALGGDSLGAVHLFVRIERLTGRRLPLSSIMRAPTVARMAELVRTDAGYSSAWHLATLGARGTEPPIFFVHGLRGGVVFLRGLVEALGPDQPSFAFEADGRFEGPLDATSIEDLAAAYVDLLRGVRPQGPYHLCGYSAGGLIAFEIARQLAAEREEVAFLGLIDTYAPVAGRRVSTLQKKLNHARVLRALPRGERVAFARRTADRVLRREQKRAGGPDVDGPLRRALLELLEAYEPDGGYRGHIDLFRPSIPFLGARMDRALGWDRCAVASFTVHDVPGDHRTVFEAGNAQALAKSISRKLNRTEAGAD
ncbi:MAG: amino acid adenylation domain-containing protein [Blastocatellia bacterium]|nr:amino acid adenylation domain-containing protein [Blastocatellia bacterium]